MAEHALALAVASAALLVWPPGPARGRLLARSSARPAPVGRWAGRHPALTVGRRRLLVDAGAALGVAVLLGGVPGLVAGVVGAVCVDRAQRRAAGRADLGAAAADLPVAGDLLAVCLSAGLPVAHALAAVASVVGEPLTAALDEVAARYRLGAEAHQAWADAPPELAGLARALTRASTSGSAVARSLREVAADARAVQRSRTEARVRQSGVWLLAPLGACFLPAFLCLGVVPLVLGIASDVLG